jgi:hypothetical protein
LHFGIVIGEFLPLAFNNPDFVASVPDSCLRMVKSRVFICFPDGPKFASLLPISRPFLDCLSELAPA